jgi:6-phosphogluconolactonase
MVTPEIKVVADLAAMVEEAAGRIAAEAKQAIAARGRLSVALSGGNTPKPVYERLTREPYRLGVEWAKVEVFY